MVKARCGPNHPGLSLSRFMATTCQRPHVCDFDLLSSRYPGYDRDLPAL